MSTSTQTIQCAYISKVYFTFRHARNAVCHNTDANDEHIKPIFFKCTHTHTPNKHIMSRREEYSSAERQGYKHELCLSTETTYNVIEKQSVTIILVCLWAFECSAVVDEYILFYLYSLSLSLYLFLSFPPCLAGVYTSSLDSFFIVCGLKWSNRR